MESKPYSMKSLRRIFGTLITTRKSIHRLGTGRLTVKTIVECYKNLRNTDPDDNPKRLALLAGAEGQFWHCEGGDAITILAPTKDLVAKADDTNDYNTCSYVLLVEANGSKVVFGGDSHDDTWEYILGNFKNEVTDVDLLIAPHHGRDSDRSYEFLDRADANVNIFWECSFATPCV